MPKLLYLFGNYPKLEESKLIEGKLHVVQSPYRHGGRRSLGGMPDPKNYVIDRQGVSYRLFTGVIGDTSPRFGHKDFEGLKVRVWLHPWYGLIKGDYEKTPEMSALFAKQFPLKEWGKSVDRPEYEQIFKDRFSDSYDSLKIRSEGLFQYNRRKHGRSLLIFLLTMIYPFYCLRKFIKLRKSEKLSA